MTFQNQTHATAIERFRQLHASGCFIIPNPWDPGSARYLQHAGFAALATTSAGFAFSRGRPDEVTALPRDVMLAHIREIVAATPLPVNADFQSGYADSPEGVAESVRLCVATGVAGLSIEDATGDPAAPLYPDDVALARVRAARAAIDVSGLPVLLTARCEAWLVGHPQARRVALDRLIDFAAAGADCLYAPGLKEEADIAELVRAVAPRPVNVLVSAPSPTLTVARLAELGVRRISVGSALARVAWGAFMRAAGELAKEGTFNTLGEAASFSELNRIFARPRD